MERLLEKDMVVRIISLILAVAIWATVSSDVNAPKPRRMDGVPLVQIGLAKGFQITSIPATVTIDVSGPSKTIDKLQSSDLKATVDLTAIKEPGNYELPVDVVLPPGSNLTLTNAPGRISIGVDQRLDMTLRPQISPLLPVLDGDRRVEVKQPAQDVTVSGLSPQMARVDRVLGDLDPAAVDKSGERLVRLRAADANGQDLKGVTITPDQVSVQVTVTPLGPGRMLPVRLQWTGVAPDAYTVTYDLAPKQVKVRGPADQQEAWAEVLTEPVSLSGKSGTFVVKARLIKPPGATALDQDSVTASITMEEAKDQRVFKNLPLKVNNLATNLQATPSVTAVQVTVSGPRSKLAALDPLKVEAGVDLANLGAGDHRLQVSVGGVEGLAAVPLPDIVSVNLAEKKP